jgi:hypothetical protein
MVTTRRPIAVVLVSAVAALAVSACAPGDIAFEGKIFNALGSAIGGGESQKEAKLAPRPGLVLPPALDKLPDPGSSAVPDGQIAEIQDFDRKKVVDKSKLAAAQKQFCEKNYEEPKRRGDQTVDDVQGPDGPCRPSALNALSKWNKAE